MEEDLSVPPNAALREEKDGEKGWKQLNWGRWVCEGTCNSDGGGDVGSKSTYRIGSC